MMSDQEKYNELAYYTLAHQDSSFIHQNIVDAFAAETADESTKPIKITFALLGLYLYLEKGFTGKQVQLMHMKLGKMKKEFHQFTIPKEKGEITIDNVLATIPGPERDTMIKKWCASVWQAWHSEREKVIGYLRSNGVEL